MVSWFNIAHQRFWSGRTGEESDRGKPKRQKESSDSTLKQAVPAPVANANALLGRCYLETEPQLELAGAGSGNVTTRVFESR
jgi:hypothetical protein